ncbi:hypothetical protein [Arenimonas sp. MALMAid1274]|uniref:hypothetical protein n=1 Tax=Arenimonas sp. MALMAid1274 TaxID=3411630 RepID=UPI003BA0C5FF
MNPATPLRLPAAALVALLLCACQGTTFRAAPVADAGCDPALAGTWLSQDEDPEDVGEVILRIDARCRLHVDERKPEGLKRGDGVQAHVGRHGSHRYAWVDARWVHTRFEEAHVPPAGDVYLMRYAIEGGVLSLWTTDDKLIAHAIIDNELTGEVISRDSRLFNRLTGEADPAVLDRPGFFKAEPAQFRRATETAR